MSASVMEAEQPTSDVLKAALVARAACDGFDAVGVTAPDRIGQAGERLAAFLEAGRHGDMAWMAEHAGRRSHPSALWPEVRSIVMLGMNYGPAKDPLAILQERWRGAMSVYARGRDYHDVVKGKLKTLAGWLHRETGEDVKVFVDTAPVMEKPLAQAAGIGWQGKHTNLVSQTRGSWLFLGAIFTTAHLPPDEPERDHCGNCRACLDICPTQAFPAPYQLDARRCISYLTIEHKGHIPREFREAMGNRIYGCDDCLAVCPWNKFARAASEAKFECSTGNTPLAQLMFLDDAGFRAAFAGTAAKRTGRDRFMRNVLIAAGNSGDQRLIYRVAALLEDASPLVRAMAVWAMRKLLPHDPRRDACLIAANQHPDAVEYTRTQHLPRERDEAVRAEWLYEVQQ